MSYDYFMRMCVHLFHAQVPPQGNKNENKSFTERTFFLSALLEVKNVTEHSVRKNTAGKQKEKYKQFAQTDTVTQCLSLKHCI